ncbi:class I adenylate-forming enzyme family protein [Nocardia jiangxiensis]|uniref:Class I adenylate-forming enzyme family protein n=1 Tax=Nocardia jiangxiensis TaxID=282685 RepID=A0ABW6S922_9NOCA
MTENNVATTMDAVVRARADEHPAAEMVIDPKTRLTYAELDRTTAHLAGVLVAAGVGKGSRVGLLMPNSAQWVQIAVAVTRIGATLVPLSTLLRPPELRTQLQVGSVQYLIAVEQFRGRNYLAELESSPTGDRMLSHPRLPALRHVLSTSELTGATAPSYTVTVADALTATVTPADPLAIMFTSGSRGLPKAVIHSHGNAFAAVRSGLSARLIDDTTRLYLPMPFFWVGGFGGGVLSALLAGATLVTEDIPAPEATLHLLRQERVNLFRGWPDQAESLARQAKQLGVAVPPLRAGSLPALLPEHMRAQPGARANLFGMTESFGPYCGYPADTDMPRSAWGSCGRPFEGMEVRIADPDSGVPVSTGTVGVIQLRGPHTLRGMCRRSRAELFTIDGFYSTGDLGHLDGEGFLFYHGRSDDMFKVSGATVYPSEVEGALRSLPGISAAFVTNITGAQGDRVAAAVVCDTATTTTEHLRTAAKSILSSFKVPSVWLLLDSDDSIPRGSTGKIDILGLRKLLTPHP